MQYIIVAILNKKDANHNKSPVVESLVFKIAEGNNQLINTVHVSDDGLNLYVSICRQGYAKHGYGGISIIYFLEER